MSIIYELGAIFGRDIAGIIFVYLLEIWRGEHRKKYTKVLVEIRRKTIMLRGFLNNSSEYDKDYEIMRIMRIIIELNGSNLHGWMYARKIL